MVRSRAARLSDNSPETDAIVIVNGDEPFCDSAFWYLTEQKSGTFEGGIAVVRDGKLDVIVSTLEEETAREGCGEIHVYSNRAERDGLLKELLNGCTDVGFNTLSAPYASVRYIEKTAGINVKNASKEILETLTVKDEKELKSIRRACEISSKVASEIPEILTAGMTEKEAAFAIDFRMRELGGEGNAFETIAAFGPNSSKPHHSPTDRKISKGDAALFDFGTKYEKYCSDLTRTVFFGKPDERMERAYETVKKAQEEGFSRYREGAPAADADIAAREIIDAGEFKGRMIHTFGHGIGMDIHQGISVYSKSDYTLKAGNVVSAEPGIYLPGIGGIRIEDTCLVLKDGAERLTSFDRELTVV
ncbi:MAG: M24 family metallopeptidase [Candidatus Methanomethylophilaceae archaeon]|jgi:Xaa-Pro dipeptidase